MQLVKAYLTESSLVRLAKKAWKGMDCEACVKSEEMSEDEKGEKCAPRSWEEDYAEEVERRFPKGKPRKLYKETQFLWSEGEPLRTFTPEPSQENWDFPVEDPAQEEYVEGKVTVSGTGPDGKSPIGTIEGVGLRFKGFF